MSQTSLRVGNAGTAWRSRVSGTSPTIAIVAAWRKSTTSEPVIVAPTMIPALLVDQEAARSARAAAVVRAAGIGRGPDVDDARSNAGVLRGPRGVADGGDLRIREDHARRARPIGAVLERAVGPEHVIGGDAGLVLGHVGERCAAVEVSDRVEPVVARHLGVLVDLDVSVGLEADRLEPEAGDLRGAPDRDEQLVAADDAAVAERHRHLGAVAPDRLGLLAGADVDAQLLQRLGDLGAGELLLARQQPPLTLDQGHLRAQRAIRLPHLDADDAAAQDDQAVGDRIRRGRLAVGPRPRLGEPVDRRHGRRRPAGEDHRPADLERLLAHDHAALAVDAPPAAVERDAAVLEPGQLRAVVEAVDDLVAAIEHGARVELAGRGLRRARHPAQLGEDLAGSQQRLRRHAGPVRALAADLAILHDRNIETGVGQPAGRHLAARTGAEHHHVEAAHRTPWLEGRTRLQWRGIKPLGTTGFDVVGSWGWLRVEVPEAS